jgi:heme-degrading monooxygenase HmoA
MIFEIATITVKAGEEAAFESAVARAVPLFRRAHGCQSLRLERSIEEPDRYRLVVGWATVEDHTVRFRNSPDFAAWRALVADSFAAAPAVEHMKIVVDGFDGRT